VRGLGFGQPGVRFLLVIVLVLEHDLSIHFEDEEGDESRRRWQSSSPLRGVSPDLRRSRPEPVKDQFGDLARGGDTRQQGDQPINGGGGRAGHKNGADFPG
jgi:hypothetical protein